MNFCKYCKIKDKCNHLKNVLLNICVFVPKSVHTHMDYRVRQVIAKMECTYKEKTVFHTIKINEEEMEQ